MTELQMMQEAVKLLALCGITTAEIRRYYEERMAITMPVVPGATLFVIRSESGYWAGLVALDPGMDAILYEPPEMNVAADSADPEEVAVYALRSLLRAGHAYSKKLVIQYRGTTQ